MIAPAHLDLERAYQLLERSTALSNEDFMDAAEVQRAGGQPSPGMVFVSENFVMVRDFAALIANRAEAERVVARVEAANKEGKKLLVISDIDPKYWLRWRHGSDPFPDGLFYRWEALLVDLPSFRLKIPAGEYVPRRKADYRRNWEHSSNDERLLLAGLHYEDVVNYRDLSGLISLYQRGLITFGDFQFRFDDPRWREFVARQMPKDEFKKLASRHENKLWLSFRGPILLALLVVIGFVAYVAQDEMRIAFSILATVGTTLATVGALSNRIRDFRSYLGA
jgi:hypothetical protein